MMPLKNLVGAAIFVALIAGCSADDSRIVVNTNPDLFAVRGEIVKRVESGELPSVSVAVAHHGETIWQESFGWQDIENKVPATPSTIYAIGSVAKSISATGVMAQVDSGNLNLDQPVESIIGKDAIQSYGGSGSEITLRDVLSMTAGIPHGWVGMQAKAEMERPLLEQIVHDYAFVAYPPGEVFEYSNNSMGVAQYILEKSTGISFSEYMGAAVFGPLNMRNTFVGEEPRNRKNFAQRYTSSLDNVAPSYFIPSGGGGAFSSAEDLLAFAVFHLGIRRKDQSAVLTEVALQQMHHDKSASQGAIGAGPGWSLGMGSITLDDGTSWYMSNGSVAGGNAIALMFPKEEIAIVCLTNRTGVAADQIARQIAGKLIEDYDEMFAEATSRWRASQPSPYQPSDKSSGIWAGHIISNEVSVPISFSFDRTGNIVVTIDGSDSITVQNPRLGGGRFQGRLSVAAPNHIVGPNSSSGETDLRLIAKDREMYGYLSVRFQMDSVNYSIPVYIALKKVE